MISHPLWARIGPKALFNLNDVTAIIVLPAPYAEIVRIYAVGLPNGHMDIRCKDAKSASDVIEQLENSLLQRMSMVSVYAADAQPLPDNY